MLNHNVSLDSSYISTVSDTAQIRVVVHTTYYTSYMYSEKIPFQPYTCTQIRQQASHTTCYLIRPRKPGCLLVRAVLVYGGVRSSQCITRWAICVHVSRGQVAQIQTKANKPSAGHDLALIYIRSPTSICRQANSDYRRMKNYS